MDVNNKTSKTNGQQRSSIKSLLTKKFQPLSSSASINITTKQKKPRNSFRNFSQFLKRSHSSHNELSTTNDQPTIVVPDLVYQSFPITSSDEYDSIYPTTRSNTSLSNSTTNNNTTLVPISEEDNPLPIKQQNKSKINNENIDDQQQQHVPPKIAPSLSKKNNFFDVFFL